MRKAKKRELPRPTDLELSLLQVLWQHGPASVREVFQHFNEGRESEAGYTTVLKMLQIMTDKGLVERDDSSRPQIYSPRLTQAETQQQLIGDLLERAFGGSAKQLVMRALETRAASDEELTEIERVLDRLEGDA